MLCKEFSLVYHNLASLKSIERKVIALHILRDIIKKALVRTINYLLVSHAGSHFASEMNC